MTKGNITIEKTKPPENNEEDEEETGILSNKFG